MSVKNRNIILGLGNTLNLDEGVGVHLLTEIREKFGSRIGMEILDGGTLGLNLLPWVEESQHLLLLDAIDAGHEPASIVELGREEIPLFAQIKLSQHQLSFQEVLGLAQVRGNFPPYLHLIGIQPADVSMGVGLSPSVLNKIPELLNRVEKVLTHWEMLAPVQH